MLLFVLSSELTDAPFKPETVELIHAFRRQGRFRCCSLLEQLVLLAQIANPRPQVDAVDRLEVAGNAAVPMNLSIHAERLELNLPTSLLVGDAPFKSKLIESIDAFLGNVRLFAQDKVFSSVSVCSPTTLA